MSDQTPVSLAERQMLIDDEPERLILITIQDSTRGYWYPRAVMPAWIATMIEQHHYGADIEPFKLWDIDAEGTPHPAEIRWGLSVSNDNDYTHSHGEIVNSASGEKIADIFTTIDDRA